MAAKNADQVTYVPKFSSIIPNPGPFPERQDLNSSLLGHETQDPVHHAPL